MPTDVFQEALLSFAQRVPAAIPWDTAAMNQVHPAIRQHMFWSARQENMRFLQKSRDLISDFLNGETEIVNGERLLKVGGRADFVRQMREFQLETGMVESEEDFKTGRDEGVQTIQQRGRLNLIFDTNVRNAWGHGRFLQSMTPDALRTHPAQEFVRLPGATTKRERHEMSEGAIRLKTDFDFWEWQNDPEIGGFGTPHEQFGFNSFMTLLPIRKRQAERWGLKEREEEDGTVSLEPLSDNIKPDIEGSPPVKIARAGPMEAPKQIGLNEGLKTSLKGIDPDIREHFIEGLEEDQRTLSHDGIDAAGLALLVASQVAVTALMNALDEARRKKDEKEMKRISKEIKKEITPSLFDRVFQFVIEGDFVRMIG